MREQFSIHFLITKPISLQIAENRPARLIYIIALMANKTCTEITDLQFNRYKRFEKLRTDLKVSSILKSSPHRINHCSSQSTLCMLIVKSANQQL